MKHDLPSRMRFVTIPGGGAEMRRLLLLTCLLLAASPAPAIAQDVNFVEGCEGSVHQPLAIALTCADGKVVFETERWETWGPDEASTSGTLTYPDCAPSVALAACRTYRHDAARVRLWRPAFCPSVRHWQFTRLQVWDLERTVPTPFEDPVQRSCKSFGELPSEPPTLLPVSYKCRVIDLNGLGYIFYFRQMGCYRARTLATFAFREHQAPQGFRCQPRQPGLGGAFCERRGDSRRVFGWYREEA